MQTIFKGATIEALFNEESRMIEVSYFGSFTKSAEFRETVLKAGEWAIAHAVSLWLLDQRNMNLHPKDLEWFYREWQPAFDQAMPQGRKVAIIPAKNLFSEFGVKTANKKLLEQGNTNIKYFLNMEEARQWLLES